MKKRVRNQVCTKMCYASTIYIDLNFEIVIDLNFEIVYVIARLSELRKTIIDLGS